MQYYIGCSGWSYSSWQGPFYPKTIENSRWLKYYSSVFDYVEIDSTFYRIPNDHGQELVQQNPEEISVHCKISEGHNA
jgi:uncharacterized protein YecE (DUF72 family)